MPQCGQCAGGLADDVWVHRAGVDHGHVSLGLGRFISARKESVLSGGASSYGRIRARSATMSGLSCATCV